MKPAYTLSLAAGLLLALVLSCSSDEESDKPVPPPGPAELSIKAFIGANGETFSRDEAGEIRLDCSRLLAVELSETNWLFRPPGNCGATPQCGHVAVAVDDVVVEASTRTVVVPLGEDAAGTHHVRAELRLGDHTAFIGDAGTAVSDELDVTITVLPCPDAGMGGGAGQGGMPAVAGAGGVSESGGAGNGMAGAGGVGEGGVGGQGGAPASGGQGGIAGNGGASAGAGGG